jgi:CubicO group peptidase (beta-lactamase class C family)
MKKALLIPLACMAGLVVLLLVIWLGAHLFTANSQVARAIAWLDSDVEDYRKFPMRVIANAPPVFNFRQPPPEEQNRYAPVFDPVIQPLFGHTITARFNSFLEQTDTAAFLVIKDDILLYEKYFNGYDHNSTVTSFSMAKSFDSALVGIAIAEGYIDSVEDPITKYVQELADKDRRYQNITLRNLLTMSSGIRYEEFSLPWTDDATTYYSPDLRQAATSSAIIADPGKKFHYNNFNPLLIGLVLERTTRQHVATYLADKIWKPLGMEAPGSWSLDSEASGFEKMESGINGRAIDFAKFGRLFLNNGNWNGKQVISRSWVDESTRLDTLSDPAAHYQYFWWINPGASGKHHFFAAGKHGQYIYVVPELNLMMLRFGKTDPYRNWPDFFESIADRINTVAK